MIRILSKLYLVDPTEEGFTCGYAFESSFHIKPEMDGLIYWMAQHDFKDFGISQFEHLMFKRVEDAERFALSWPAMV